MKTNQNEQIENNVTIRPTLAQRCMDSCRKVIGQINKSKEAILTEFRSALGAHEKVLRLALNEAEALSWQTEYPHLLFPVLAMEKAQAVAAWDTRQRAIQGTYSRRALAA
jgi:hypothetical protein